jgi:hypothetical protein
MAHREGATRVAGVWLAIASLLLAGALVGHGPIHPDMSQQMEVIADGPVRWAIIHWASAASLSLFALTGLIVLTATSRLTFSEGKATGIMFLALAVAVIAGNEAQTAHRATPAWASCIAVVAGIGAFLGWPLGMWFGITLGSFIWVVASLVMSLWTLWFGLGLARGRDRIAASQRGEI